MNPGYTFPSRGNSKYKGREASLKNSIGARGYGVLEVIGGCITGPVEAFIRPLAFTQRQEATGGFPGRHSLTLITDQ